MVLFGQLVVGPPGSGKTTYCHGLQQMCDALQRKCIVVNLDPANDAVPYTCTIDVRDVVAIEDAVKQHGLGPNGALMYCMEDLLVNIDWLIEKLKEYSGYYVLFDCPGQVELYTHNTTVLGIIDRLRKALDARLTAVHLVDSILCTEASKYVSALLVSLSCQLLLELPHINLLTKVDLLKLHRQDMVFRLEYYAEVQDLRYLLDAMADVSLTPNHPFDKKFRKLQFELCSLVDDFNLCAFLPLDIQDKEMVLRVLQQADTANGFALSGMLDDPVGLFKYALRPTLGLQEETFGALQEHCIDVDVSHDEGPAESELESIQGS